MVLRTLDSSLLPIVAALAASVLLGGCGADTPPNRSEAGADLFSDWYAPWEAWLPPDYGSTPDAGPRDGPKSPDSATCKKPSGVTCSSACGLQQACTGASGGSCATTLSLVGSADQTAVLVKVATAYVDCWNKQPGTNLLCATFDTCQMTGSLTRDKVRNWICNKAQISDFPSASYHSTARSILACAIPDVIERPLWYVTSVDASEVGLSCMSFHDYGSMPWDLDRVDIDLCKNYPPK